MDARRRGQLHLMWTREARRCRCRVLKQQAVVVIVSQVWLQPRPWAPGLGPCGARQRNNLAEVAD